MGKLAGYNHQITTVVFGDQAGDDTIGILKAPYGGLTVKAAYAIATDTVSARS